MDILNQAMIYLLDTLQGVLGSYGWAIVAVTVLLRVVTWPMNTAQTRSMKKMQELQPKLKAIQEKHADNPQKLQEAMMRFYSENKFNPLAGCLPMLIQLPILIALYGALNSPEFLIRAGNESFLFIDRLYHTLQSQGGQPLDGQFTVKPDARFQSGKVVTLILKSGKQQELRVDNPDQLLQVRPSPLIPGEKARFIIPFESLHLSEDYASIIDRAETTVIDLQTREVEPLAFSLSGKRALAATVPTQPVQEGTFNLDVLSLILLYAALTLGYQKLMESSMSAKKNDDPQAKMMRLLPLFFLGFLVFFPIPAGVMLYLVVTTLMMLIQTGWIYWQDREASAPPKKPSNQIVDIQPNGTA
ncbi:MAG: YidC/Oxa1 family membrane protein insertase [Candidatus Melainabacteria bacterium]|nr:YidC/Oxa1 family membrane protein insertase [Candidatus Melainabacteria bacterium]